MPASVWKGSIVLSFVSIPVRLFAAARSERAFLHQLHTVCHLRLRQPLYCPTCERFVKRDEVVKGYEVDEGQYVLVEGDEIKKLAAKSSRVLEVSHRKDRHEWPKEAAQASQEKNKDPWACASEIEFKNRRPFTAQRESSQIPR